MIKVNESGKICQLCVKWVGIIEHMIDEGVPHDAIIDAFRKVIISSYKYFKSISNF